MKKYSVLAAISLLCSGAAFADHGFNAKGECVEFTRNGNQVIVNEGTKPFFDCRVRVNELFRSRKVLLNNRCFEQYLVKKVDGNLFWKSYEEENRTECRLVGGPALGSQKYQFINGTCFEMSYYKTIGRVVILPQDEAEAEYCRR